jgi:hypothetical protein
MFDDRARIRISGLERKKPSLEAKKLRAKKGMTTRWDAMTDNFNEIERGRHPYSPQCGWSPALRSADRGDEVDGWLFLLLMLVHLLFTQRERTVRRRLSRVGHRGGVQTMSGVEWRGWGVCDRKQCHPGPTMLISSEQSSAMHGVAAVVSPTPTSLAAVCRVAHSSARAPPQLHCRPDHCAESYTCVRRACRVVGDARLDCTALHAPPRRPL